jgi:hypothetical protein
MKQAHRFSGPGKAYAGLTKLTKAGPQWTGVVRTVESALFEPLSWRKPQRVFVNSMSDLFHEDVRDDFIDAVFLTMREADRHTFQILTKRAGRMLAYMTSRADFNFLIQLDARATVTTPMATQIQTVAARLRSPPLMAPAERLARRVRREPALRGRADPAAAADAGGGAVHQRGAIARADRFVVCALAGVTAAIPRDR